jgi:hypothetical protein
MADPIAETTVVPITAAVAGAMNEGAPTDDNEASSAHEQDRTGDGPAAASPKGDVEPAPAVLPQPDAQKEQGPQSLTLKDVNVGNKDGRGFQITRIYAVQSARIRHLPSWRGDGSLRGRPRESAGPERRHPSSEFG